MPKSTLVQNEQSRLAELHALQILDTAPEQRYDCITRLASKLFSVPIAIISLVDHQRQWFKSHYGLDVCEIPRNISFCAHTLESGQPLIVEDALLDLRFVDNPLVTKKPGIRFYAGCPIKGPSGHVLGTICLIDTKPRLKNEFDLLALQDLAAVVEQEISRGLLAGHLASQASLLNETQVLLSQHIEKSPLAMVEWDANFAVKGWSALAEQLFGWAKGEVLGKTPSSWAFVYKDDVESVNRVMTQLLHNKEIKNISRNRNYRKDGSVVHCIWFNTIVFDDNGKMLSILSFVQDDTARNKAEQALAKSERQLRDTFEQAAVGIAHVAGDGSWLRVNKKLCDIIGYSMAELLGLTFQDITYAEDLQKDTLLANKIWNHETETYTLEKRYIHKQGHLVWIKLTVSLAKDEFGNSLYFIAIIEDIEARKQTEFSLQHSRELLEDRVIARTHELSTKQRLLDAILQTINVGIVACDAEGKLTLFNRATKELHGLEKVDVHSEQWSEHYSLFKADGITLLEPKDVPLYKALHGQAVINDAIVIASTDGKKRTLNVSGQKLYDEQGVALGAVVAMHDVSEQQIHEAELHAKEILLRTIMDSIPALVAYVDLETRYQYCNKQFEAFFDTNIERILGKTIEEFLGSEHYKPIEHLVKLALNGVKTTFERALEVQGRETYIEGHYIPDLDLNGIVRGFYIVVWDVTQAKHREIIYKKQASLDSMTGLLNKQSIANMLVSELEYHQTLQDHLAVMFMDIDHFKKVNDSLGHHAGDELINHIASCIKLTVRATDHIGRFGGDEFLIILPHIKSEEAAERVAQKLLSTIHQPIQLDTTNFTPSISIGIGFVTKASLSYKEAIKLADEALYQAKGAGRGNYQIKIEAKKVLKDSLNL